MDVGELGMGVFEVRQRDLPGRPGRAASGFGDAELDTVGHLDTGTMIGPGHRVSDRLARGFEDTGHLEMPAPGFDIYVDLDGQEQRLQLIRAHGGKDPPYGRRIIGLRASQDFSRASRWLSSARSSMITCIVPFPSWIAPGQLVIRTARSPSRRIEPKYPSLIS